jgi:hypothetical protein
MTKYIVGKKQGCQTVGAPDDFGTPTNILSSLIPFLKPQSKIWECASGTDIMVDGFREKGFNVIGTTLYSSEPERKVDFVYDVEKGNAIATNIDYIITNPPYSLKDEFIERCYQIGKPFALLMPLTALEGKKRQAMYKKYGLQLIIPNKRINFITPDGKGAGSWFTTAWFTYGLNLAHDIEFVNATW